MFSQIDLCNGPLRIPNHADVRGRLGTFNDAYTVYMTEDECYILCSLSGNARLIPQDLPINWM